MKKIVYFIEFILIKVLFIFFKIIGYKYSSNLGFLIGKIIGPIFRSKKLIIKNLQKANLQKQNNLEKIASDVLVIMEEFLLNMFTLKILEMIN